MSKEFVDNQIPQNNHQNNIPQRSSQRSKSSSQQRHLQESEKNEDDRSEINNDQNQYEKSNSKQDDQEQIENENISSQQQSQKTNKRQSEAKQENLILQKGVTSSRTCFNKLCNSKKIYKKVRSKVVIGKYRFLCRPCYDNYSNNNYCQFCEQLYSNNQNESQDFNNWIGCDNCQRWNHNECQKKYRNKDISEAGENNNSTYLCLGCTMKLKGIGQVNLPQQNGNQQQQQIGNEYKYRYRTQRQYNTQKRNKLKVAFAPQQKFPIFHKKIENYTSLQGLLQNNSINFRLAINDNSIKEDLQILRTASNKLHQTDRPRKKIKTQ